MTLAIIRKWKRLCLISRISAPNCLWGAQLVVAYTSLKCHPLIPLTLVPVNCLALCLYKSVRLAYVISLRQVPYLAGKKI